MMNTIHGLEQLQASQLKLDNNNDANEDKKIKFSDLLRENLSKVNNLQLDADEITQDFALGKTDNIHSVMIASEKAETAMKLTLAVQNKAVSAYKEIMRMQV